MSLGEVDATTFRISLQVGLLAALLCILAGTPLAWWIARARPGIAWLLSSLALLPLVLPPTAIGYYLLTLFGRGSGVGRFLIDELGLRLIFTWPGAAAAAAAVALPLYVRTALAGFEHVDADYIDVVRTFGKGRFATFVRVELPLAWPSLVAAGLIGFARGIGEFGATVIVAGNIPGETQTVPTAIYDAVQAGDHSLANAYALLFLAAGLMLLAALTLALRRAR